MDEPRQHDAASLTDSVRQFRRVARLAAADPLRVLPLGDVLAQTAALSAPVVELIDLAPFERLRDSVAPPAAAARREASRVRQQPFPTTANDTRTKRAKVTDTPEPAAKSVAPAVARQTASPSQLQSSEDRPRRETSTLAERRAELRRRTVDAGSPSGSTAPAVPQAQAPAGSRNTSPIEAREIAIPPRRRGNDDIRDPARRLMRVPFEPDNIASTPNEPLAPSAVDRSTRPTMFSDNRPASSSPIDRPSAPEALTATARIGTNDIGGSSVQASSSSVASLMPLDPRMPTADAGPAQRRRGWELPSEPELADALFEALYRDGVDLTWP